MKEEQVVVKHTIDLGASPQLPFDTAKVIKHAGEEIVGIELRPDDNLYIDGKEVKLSLSEIQKSDGQIYGHELLEHLEDRGNIMHLNSNVLDCIFGHQELFPEHWKINEYGEIYCITFGASTFLEPWNNHLYVRCLSWFRGEPVQDHRYLGDVWFRQFPCASVEKISI